ncbi:MAG TPA: deoxyribose-phosphate aldolase [Vulgatibacter sp.]
MRAGVARIAPDRIRTSLDIAPLIDHTLLKPEASRDDVIKLCDEARKHGFATVCVNSVHVGTAARALAGSKTVPIAVVGFPLGAGLPSAKAFEAREAVRCGAREIDMVINIGALKARDYSLVQKDIAAVVEASKPWPVKVILETSQLNDDEKIAGCVLSKAAGAAFVKTSTGFGGGGATVHDVALMRRIVGDDVGVKASGGIRSSEDAMAMIQAGANRIGASASVAIVLGKKSDAKY